MTRLIYKTKDGSDNIREKTRVYFSCHREDFETVFEPVCKDIFGKCDCVIYYREDISDSLDPETHDLDLGLMNLFVFAVTRKMLNGSDREVLRDLEFAKAVTGSESPLKDAAGILPVYEYSEKEDKCAILPIVFEREIDAEFCALYEREELFGHIQFLSKLSGDLTEIGYYKKLREFFNSSLFITDEERSAIHEAFDKHIFLSYRKKDRKFANELIHLIHSDPDCRYIAVWYDEFLSAGENYDDQIKASMEKSDLVVLLVTPNLLEEGNFVMETEYPDACGMGKKILPVEIVPLFGEPTDRAEIYAKYKGLPEVLSVDDANFKEARREGLKDLINPEQEYDSDRDYLMGLAYFEGIDVEKNHSYATELIERAEKAGNPNARGYMFKRIKASSVSNELRKISVKINSSKWGIIGEDINSFSDEGVSLYRSIFGDLLDDLRGTSQKLKNILLISHGILGETDVNYLDGLYALGSANYRCEQYEEAFASFELCYSLRCMALGKEHIDSLYALSWIAKTYRRLHDFEKARKLFYECYEIKCRKFGEEHKDTLDTLYDLAVTYYFLGERDRSFETFEKCYQAQCRVLGEDHKDTCRTFKGLIDLYRDTGDKVKELELRNKQYETMCKVNGEEDSHTLISLFNLSFVYFEINKFDKALDGFEKFYEIQSRVLDKEDDLTIKSLEYIIAAYEKLSDYRKAAGAWKKYYEIQCKLHGKRSPEAKKAHKQYIADTLLGMFFCTIPGKIVAFIIAITIYLPIKAVIGLFKKLFGGKNGDETK